MAKLTTAQKDKLKKKLLASFWEFAKYMNPYYAYGEVHEDFCARLQHSEHIKEDVLELLPRGHLKSHLVATYVTWRITRNPAITTVYLSAGEDLATLQVGDVKNQLLSERYRELWPEMVNEAERSRDKWSALAINVDHPERKEQGVRDYTLAVRTIRSSSTGLHCDLLILDDVVTDKNAYTEAGRRDVSQSVSQFASIKNPDAETVAVGTRYHEKDVYGDFIRARIEIIDPESGECKGTKPLWRVNVVEVEDSGDGTGEYCWPRTQSPKTGKWYGFDSTVLAKKKAEYVSVGQRAQFYAQYYHKTSDPEGNRLDNETFLYYSKKKLSRDEYGSWYYDGDKLRVYAGMDIAYTDINEVGGKKADFTAIVVIGVSARGFIYVLDIRRFKTSKYDVYYNAVIELHNKWNFKRLNVETNAGGKLVASELKRLIREEGKALAIIGKPATRNSGKKFERKAAVLEPRYTNGTIWRYKGGLTSDLEDELVLEKPPHDDLTDAEVIAVENAKIPNRVPAKGTAVNHKPAAEKVAASSRFGGRVRRGRR